MTLNTEQQAAADGFFEFLLTDETEMNISGPGGTGKTHLMGEMIDKIMPAYFQNCKMFGMEPQYTSVHMTATTNKAAEVLSNSAGRPTQTVQSFFNLTVFDDYSTGKSSLKKSKNWMVHENKVIFVDEGSMIDTPLDRMTKEGMINCKVVYVGDHCQLAPIMEPISPIYRREMRTYHLTEPMRTDVPELHALNTQLRNQVEEQKFAPIQIVPGIIDWCSPEQMEAEVAAHFARPEQNRILAYTNRTVTELNAYVRELRTLPAIPTAGEVLVSNTAVKLRGYMLSVEEEVTIIDVKPLIESVFITYDSGDEVFMDCYVMTIETKLGGVFTDVKVPVDKEYFEKLKKWLSGKKEWGPFYELKNGYPDLRERDASTFHKAQGSSLDTVFIDASNLSTCHNPNVVSRMLYVGNSRARKRVVYYGQLAAKYGGFIF